MPSSNPGKAFCPVVLIPAYKPDTRLPQLVELLCSRGLEVLVVDDGGGEQYLPYFQQCESKGAQVTRHAVNLGKGRALKTGINEILLRWPDVSGIITADADGQHTPEDIVKVAEALEANPRALIVGGRAFTGNVPWKSRAGNAITRAVYRLATGVRIHDTQTGLRGLPREALAWMASLQGERYEYEMNMLLKLRDYMLPAKEVPIETVYIDDNSSSHFKPLRDGARIYGVIFRYMLSALLSAGLDYGLYLLVRPWIASLMPAWPAESVVFASYVVARTCSSLVNFKLNKHAVFEGRGGKSAVWKYYALVAAQMLIGAGLTALLVWATKLPQEIAKLPVDVALFFVSFFVQRDLIFRAPKPKEQPQVEQQ